MTATIINSITLATFGALMFILGYRYGWRRCDHVIATDLKAMTERWEVEDAKRAAKWAAHDAAMNRQPTLPDPYER